MTIMEADSFDFFGDEERKRRQMVFMERKKKDPFLVKSRSLCKGMKGGNLIRGCGRTYNRMFLSERRHGKRRRKFSKSDIVDECEKDMMAKEARDGYLRIFADAICGQGTCCNHVSRACPRAWL